MSKYIPQPIRSYPKLNEQGQVVTNNRKEQNKRGVSARLLLIQRAPEQAIVQGHSKKTGAQVIVKVKTKFDRKIAHNRVAK